MADIASENFATLLLHQLALVLNIFYFLHVKTCLSYLVRLALI